jgi:hypothetical protein
MNIRNTLQESWAESFINSSKKGILHLCPRSGKTRTSISIFKKAHKILNRVPKILIAYPDKNLSLIHI